MQAVEDDLKRVTAEMKVLKCDLVQKEKSLKGIL